MPSCTACGAALASALVCEACGALQRVEAPIDPWLALGLAPGYALDRRRLKERLLALQRRMHPDFFGGAAPELRALAERNTAELNAAERLLANDAARADLWIRRAGGPDEGAERQMPKAFLMEVLEWNETLEAARQAPPMSPERAQLEPLELSLKAEHVAALGRVAAHLNAGAPALARQELNAVRYLERTLETLRELLLEQAKSAR